MNRHAASYILLLCFSIIYCACHNRIAPQSTSADPQSTSLNKEATDGQGNSQLLGRCTRQRLEQSPYNSWFVKNYTDYTVDSATANQFRSKLADKQLLIFMGTWCGDSRREVPRIFKILDYCGISADQVQLVMVSNAESTYKQSPDHEERGLHIFRVPDLIVLEKGKELGRVVESPVQSLERDLLAITGEGHYMPHYEGVTLLATTFSKEKPKKIEKELPELAGRIKPLLGSSSELKSYAHVLKAAGEVRQADLTLRLNNLIFPAGK